MPPERKQDPKSLCPAVADFWDFPHDPNTGLQAGSKIVAPHSRSQGDSFLASLAASQQPALLEPAMPLPEVLEVFTLDDFSAEELLELLKEFVSELRRDDAEESL